MRKTISMASFFVVIAALLLSSCGDPTNKQDTIKVGLIVEQTGDMPAVGASSRNAAQLAVSEINSAGGIAISGSLTRLNSSSRTTPPRQTNR
jgi:branched-chain amino acid transport system substrate-binding protein